MKYAIIILMVLAALFSFGACATKKQTLYVFIWSDYLADDLVKDFEKANNCKVVISTYDSNENMLAKIESSPKSFDVVVPSGDHITIMQQKGLLEQLDKKKLNHYGNLDPDLLGKARSFDSGNLYAIPYFWGLTGLMYNNQKVPQSVVQSNSWAIVGDAFFSGQKKITMLEDAREVIGAALIYQGFDLNSTTTEAMKAAEMVLAEWDANIIQYDSESYKNEIAEEITWLAQAYNGDALQLMAEDPNLGFILPVEGSSLWMDNLAILKASENKDLAYAFIDFLLEAENGKINAEHVSYATPNKEAYKLLDPKVTGNKLIYPDKEYLDKCTMIKFLGDDVKIFNDLFEKYRMN